MDGQRRCMKDHAMKASDRPRQQIDVHSDERACNNPEIQSASLGLRPHAICSSAHGLDRRFRGVDDRDSRLRGTQRLERLEAPI